MSEEVIQTDTQTQKPVIRLIDWWDNDICGDGCCGDWGTRLIVNDVEVTPYFQISAEQIAILLEALGIEADIVHGDSDDEDADVDR